MGKLLVKLLYGNTIGAYTRYTINLPYWMGEKAIWLDIAQMCGCTFMSCRRVRIQHNSAIFIELLGVGLFVASDGTGMHTDPFTRGRKCTVSY